MSELKSPRQDGEAKVKKKEFKKAPGNLKRHHRCELLKGRQETLYKKRKETSDGLY